MRVAQARAREEIVNLLISRGASCVQEDGEALVTSFSENTLPAGLAETIVALDPAAAVSMSLAPGVTYELHGTVTAHQVGKLYVVPTWDRAAYPSGLSIVIEPGGAFGTGDHATTRGVLQLMQTVIREGDVVADLGAGSAVLSIAAAKLGASRVAAVEMDHDAIANAEENVEANGVGDIVKIIEGDAALILPLLAPVDLVLANIVSGALIELLPAIRDSLSESGHAILSGILIAERDEMVDAFSRGGWSLDDEHSEEEWWSALITPR